MSHLFTVSPTHLEGSLHPISVDDLLASCESHAISARLSVENEGWPGTLELREGRAVDARYQNRTGSLATALLRQVDSGRIELAMDARGASDLVDVSLATVARFAADSELSGTIALQCGSARAELVYVMGTLTGIVGLRARQGGRELDRDPLDPVADLLRAQGLPLVIELEDEPDWEEPTLVYQCARPTAAVGIPATVPARAATATLPPERRVWRMPKMVAVALGLSCLGASLLAVFLL